ncbi:MAG: serine/threonine-protein phosphatase [Planctomycetes bacterium]|nr:serine/threonine-protein phosphatase [Planctomycetota bacterium]
MNCPATFFDFIDHAPVDDPLLGITIGDVVGKGVPAALHMASIRGALRAHALHLIEPAHVVFETNQAMVHDTRQHEFSTLWYCSINLKSWLMTYCNAGHEPPIVCRPNDEHDAPDSHMKPEHFTFSELSEGGMVLGVEADHEYGHGTFQCRAGDTLIAFSDGLTEAPNFDGEQFGRSRITRAVLDVLQVNPTAPAVDILNHVLWEARRFVGFNEQSDDITLVVIRFMNRH